MSQPLLLAVLGPTASGKSALGIELAKKFGGEIVNFDSVQVYRGFDIGSAKTPEAERGGIPHHLIDVLDPAEQSSAGDFARMARPILADIAGRGKTPVLVGGTGFYFKALIEGLFEGPARDEALRRRLEGWPSAAGYIACSSDSTRRRPAASIRTTRRSWCALWRSAF